MISSDGTVILSQEEYDEMFDESCSAYALVIERDKYIKDLKQKVIALIKDGRFVEALQELENETLA